MSRSPGQRAGISRGDVVTAALALLRSDGLEAVSMRRVAALLGVAPNAIYSHVPDKSALVDGILDAVLGDVVVPSRGDWRDRLEALLWDTRRVLLLHPDLVLVAQARQTVGPNAMRLGEAMLALLHDGGLRGDAAVHGMQVLLVHTIGSAAFELPRRDDPDPAARRSRGVRATRALDEDSHPHMVALGATVADHPGDVVFRLGLSWILDGLSR